MAKRDLLTMKVRLRLAALRDAAGMTDAAVARAAGQVQQEVSRFFNEDMKFPPLDFLDALARVFHYTLADVLATEVSPPSITKGDQEFLAIWKGLTPSQRTAYQGMMRGRKPRGRE